MKKLLITAVFCSAGLLLSAQKENKDEKFAKEAAEGGLMEVKLGELAQSKAKSQDVKTLAQHIVTDHTKINEELKALATKKNIILPNVLSKEGQKNYDELMGKNGDDFDKAYAKMMVKDHEKDIDLFKKESEKGEDPDLKSWAAKTLPTLEHHLEMSKTTHEKLKDTDKSAKK